MSTLSTLTPSIQDRDASTGVIVYAQPRSLPRSDHYRMWVNDMPVDVIKAGAADFAVFESNEPVHIRIEASGPLAKALLKPFSRNIASVITGQQIKFTINGPQNLCLSIPGQVELFIYANGPELNRPDKSAAGVHYFAAGQIYEVGEFQLKAGETLYIEGGAVVKGCVHAVDASNLRIAGRGIFDGSYFDFHKKERKRSFVFEECSEILIEDVIMIHPSSWMIVLGACRKAHIRGVKQIGTVISSDGIDICGSRDVLIERCCLRNEDDNVAIKSVAYAGQRPWIGNIENITVRDCIFYNGEPGNAMEIGFELSADYVRDISFENIDVIYKHGYGAVFAVHNSDRAIIENLRWENIRVEQHWDKFIDLRVFISKYTKDRERGCIRNVRFKNIHVRHEPSRGGYIVSLIGGASADRPVHDVVIEDLFIDDRKITRPEDIELLTRHCEAVLFR